MNEVKMKVAQSCPTVCNPMDYTVHGLLQARILEWVAFPFSRGSSQSRTQTGVSCLHCRRILYQLSYEVARSLPVRATQSHTSQKTGQFEYLIIMIITDGIKYISIIKIYEFIMIIKSSKSVVTFLF